MDPPPPDVTAQMQTAKLYKLKNAVDAASDNYQLLLHVLTSAAYSGIDPSIWQLAIKYAYSRFQPVVDEVNVLSERMHDFGRPVRWDPESSRQAGDTRNNEDRISVLNVPALDAQWLECASTQQLVERLATIACVRASKARIRDGLLQVLWNKLQAVAQAQMQAQQQEQAQVQDDGQAQAQQQGGLKPSK